MVLHEATHSSDDSDAPRGATARTLALGVALGLLLGAGLIALVTSAARDATRRAGVEQQLVVTQSALVDLVSAVQRQAEQGGSGDIQAALLAYTEGHEAIDEARVVSIAKRRLIASNAPADLAEGDLPYRLQRRNEDHKVWFDQGQALRASVEANRDEGRLWKDEIEIVRSEDDESVFTLAAPLFESDAADAKVTGVVLVTSSRAPPAPPSLLLPALGVAAIGGLIVLLLAGALGSNRTLQIAAAALVTLIGLAVFGMMARSALVEDRLEAERAIQTQLAAEKTRYADAIAKLPAPAPPADDLAAAIDDPDATGSADAAAADADPAADAAAAPPPPPPLTVPDPTTWDVDRFRQARGVMTLDTIDEAMIRADAAPNLGRFGWLFSFFGFVGLVLAAFVGLGYALRTWRTLVAYREAYAYIAPAMVGMLILVFFPFFYGIALSFTSQTLYDLNEPFYAIWAGLENYVEIITDVEIVRQAEDGSSSINYDNFYWTLMFTVVWTIVNVTIGVSVGLFLALILNTKGLAMRPLYRVLLILPWAIPNYITALIWKGMFHQQFGVINQFIQMFGGEPIAWFDSPFTSFIAVVTTNGWLSFPFMMVVSLGALQSIPADLYEAARVDGANRLQQFRLVTLPSLKPALVPAVILSVVWTFNMFNIIYLVSEGQPGGATEILITKAYKIAFEQYQYGYAAAYSTVIFGILLIYGTWQNRVTNASEGV